LFIYDIVECKVEVRINSMAETNSLNEIFWSLFFNATLSFFMLSIARSTGMLVNSDTASNKIKTSDSEIFFARVTYTIQSYY